MLHAQISIVDQAGRTEESATIVGSGRVSIGERPTGGLLHIDEAESDLAVVVKDGMIFFVLGAPHAPGASARIPITGTTPYEYFLEAVNRHLTVTPVVAEGEQRDAIIRMSGASSDPLASSLVRRAQASAARGAVTVSAQLQRLRAQGKIDHEDRPIAPLPDDMRADSQTDL